LAPPAAQLLRPPLPQVTLWFPSETFVGFREGQAIGIGAGDDPETAVIAVLSSSRQLQSQDITAPESGKP
jgi:hypothetical protein